MTARPLMSCGLACLLTSSAVALPPETTNRASTIQVCDSQCRKSTTPALCYSACWRQAQYGGTPGGNVPAGGYVNVPAGAAVVVTLGDSIMWGQGIPDGQKFSDIVAQWLQPRYLGTRQVFTLPSRAHSGARIQVSSDSPAETWGEIPAPTPSVPLQVLLTIADLQAGGSSADAVVLVLVDGCINDVSANSIIDPLNSSGKVTMWTNTWCPYMGPLLTTLLSSFKNAAIVVTGYYPIASSDSDPIELWALAAALAGPLGGTEFAGTVTAVAALAAKDQMVKNSSAFAAAAFSILTNAVNQANATLPMGSPPRVALAWPSFDVTNSYAASNTYLWRIGQFKDDEGNGLIGVNQPPAGTPNFVAWSRANACATIFLVKDPTCVDASMGHPNLYGVRLYADVVESQLATTLQAAMRFPPVPPPHALALNVTFGSDADGPVVALAPGTPPVKLTQWALVFANALDTGKAVVGAPIAVLPEMAGQPALGQGVTGRKFYYLCRPAAQTPIRNSTVSPVVAAACRGTVTATGGYPTVNFSVAAAGP